MVPFSAISQQSIETQSPFTLALGWSFEQDWRKAHTKWIDAAKTVIQEQYGQHERQHASKIAGTVERASVKEAIKFRQ